MLDINFTNSYKHDKYSAILELPSVQVKVKVVLV